MMRRLLLLWLVAPVLPLAAQSHAPAWRDAAPGRPITVPADHASHPDYKIEWWYYTGNLDADGGERYGYQLTFFRIGIDPAPANRSRWAVRDLFMAHVAVTDVRGRRYRFTERLNRGGPGWAGAASDRYRVWNEDWEATLENGAHHLRARADGFGLDLVADDDRAPVLHGRDGFSQKGASIGNASHYYSLTRMPTRGTITIDGRAVPVRGSSWMDHEFGTSFLEAEQVGWDWFSIQLDDGRDLMLFQMRRRDGRLDPRSSGTLVQADGTVTSLTLAQGIQMTPGRTWTSAATGARYPVAWSVRVPGAGLDLTVTTPVDDQELHNARSSGVSYWEGTIDVGGTANGAPVRGRGYLEMTGYAGRAMGDLLK